MFIARSKTTGMWLMNRGKAPYSTPHEERANIFVSLDEVADKINYAFNKPLESHDVYRISKEIINV